MEEFFYKPATWAFSVGEVIVFGTIISIIIMLIEEAYYYYLRRKE